MEGLGLDGVSLLMLSLFVTGFVEMLKHALAKEWDKAAIILCAGICGGIAGALIGFGVMLGICGGFAASGLITTAKRVGDY